MVCESIRLRGVAIHGPGEVRKAVLRRYAERINIGGKLAKNRLARARRIYASKVESVFSTIAEIVGSCSRLPRPAEMHPFYAEVASIASEGLYEDLVDGCKRAAALVARLFREYRRRILSSQDEREIESLAREYVGRALSVVRRGLRGVEFLRRAVVEITRSPCVEEGVVSIVVCGMPQTGKSTLVSRISTAKPETSPFPFTTKRVIMGHFEIGGARAAVIDTPGILDRPLDEMNEIERRAVAAIRHLAGSAIFLIDPRRGSYYSLEQQIRVLEGVEKILGRGRIVVGINKKDIASEEEISRSTGILRQMGWERVHVISALRGEGLEDLLQHAIKIARGS